MQRKFSLGDAIADPPDTHTHSALILQNLPCGTRSDDDIGRNIALPDQEASPLIGQEYAVRASRKSEA